MNLNNLLLEICMKSSDIPGTIISGVWNFISASFSKFWYIITPLIILWIIFEISTRHDNDTDNGFTPLFNSFVGGGVFCLFEYLTYIILIFLFGNQIYCTNLLIGGFYLIPFISTGIFLKSIGFWVYIRIPILNIKIY